TSPTNPFDADEDCEQSYEESVSKNSHGMCDKLKTEDRDKLIAEVKEAFNGQDPL
ncbi:hypothetical protein HDV00_011927, partial [Rhizophlyctis rosea]